MSSLQPARRFHEKTATAMARLELRSTFQMTDQGLGTLSRRDDQRSYSPPSPQTTKEETNVKKIYKKNNFGIATLISQTIFSLLDDDMRDIAASYASTKLSSLINNSIKGDIISLSKNQSDLEGFEFNTSSPFESGVGSKICLRNGAHKGHMIMHIPAFVPVKELKVPKEATNFKISARLISISDFEKSADHYTINNNSQHGKVGVYDSTMLPVLRIPTQPLTAQLSIPNIGNIKNNVTTLLILSIKFYNYRDSKFNLLADDGMMKIMKVN